MFWFLLPHCIACNLFLWFRHWFTFLNIFGLQEFSYLADFNARNKILLPSFSNRCIGTYIHLWKFFSKFDRRHFEFVSEYDTGLKHLVYWINVKKKDCLWKEYNLHYFKVTWCISLEKMQANFLISLDLFKLSGFHGAWESAHYKVVEPGVSKNQTGSTLKKFYGRHPDLVNPYNVAVFRTVSDVYASDAP